MVLVVGGLTSLAYAVVFFKFGRDIIHLLQNFVNSGSPLALEHKDTISKVRSLHLSPFYSTSLSYPQYSLGYTD